MVLPKIVSTIAVTGTVLGGALYGQATQSQSMVSSPPTSPAPEAVQPAGEAPDTTIDPASLLPDLPPLPAAKATVVGGTIDKLDRVRDQLTVRPFGGGKMRILFDARTQVYRDGIHASATDLRQGERVYVDTMLDGSAVFARTIRLKTASDGEIQGVVLSNRNDKGELVLRDRLSPQALNIHITPQTRVVGGQMASSGGLAPGTLVAVKFGAQRDGKNAAQEISVLAVPGSTFTFAGQVTALDLRLGLLAITSRTDGKTYEIYLDPAVVAVDDNLRPSADVSVLARFDGNRYVANSVTVNSRNTQ